MSEPIAEMEKDPTEKIFFNLSEYKGKKYADIRIYYEDDEGEWKPTKKVSPSPSTVLLNSRTNWEPWKNFSPLKAICPVEQKQAVLFILTTEKEHSYASY